MKNDFLLCFSKTGPIKYVGHLDLLTIFRRAARRCGLPLKYSEGFNPHPKISLALPLPLGMEGLREYAQIELERAEEASGILTGLADTLPEGLRPIEGRYVSEGEKPAPSSVCAAAYEAVLESGGDGFGEFLQTTFLMEREILVHKKTKKNEREINIRPMIYGMETANGAIRMLLAAGSAANLKPGLVTEALTTGYPADPPLKFINMKRLELYGIEDGKMLPLSERGGFII